MPTREELRAKARQLLMQAKAAPEASESLLCLVRSLECEIDAEQFEADAPPSDVIGRPAPPQASNGQAFAWPDSQTQSGDRS